MIFFIVWKNVLLIFYEIGYEKLATLRSHMRGKGYPATKISLADSRRPREFLSHMHEHNCLHFTKSTSRLETLPGKRDNIFTNITLTTFEVAIWLSSF